MFTEFMDRIFIRHPKGRKALLE